ncbi:hypothetical protein [Alloscardovia macacae]|uniref:hypothetical protein n=1 Tax=Alloscardovia macacae TaxID=1160091 RepID=UPI0011D041B7
MVTDAKHFLLRSHAPELELSDDELRTFYEQHGSASAAQGHRAYIEVEDGNYFSEDMAKSIRNIVEDERIGIPEKAERIRQRYPDLSWKIIHEEDERGASAHAQDRADVFLQLRKQTEMRVEDGGRKLWRILLSDSSSEAVPELEDIKDTVRESARRCKLEALLEREERSR